MKNSLLYSIEQDKLMKLIKSFTLATDIAMDINDCDGYPVVFHDCFYGFCKKIRSTKDGFKRCIESNAEIGLRILDENKKCIAPCFAGITLMGVPIKVGGRIHGSIVCGQFHVNEPTRKNITKMLKAADDIEVDGYSLIEEFKNIKTIPEEKFTAAGELIEFISSYIGDVIYDSQLNKEMIHNKIFGGDVRIEGHEVTPSKIDVDRGDLSPVNKVKRFISKNFNKNISLSQAAEHIHMNSSYFSRYFKDNTGINFSDYLTRFRIEKAKELIITTSLNFEKISYLTGFQSNTYFATVFKKYEGASPQNLGIKTINS